MSKTGTPTTMCVGHECPREMCSMLEIILHLQQLHMAASSSSLDEISVTSPRKLLMVTIQKKQVWMKVSPQKRNEYRSTDVSQSLLSVDQ